MLKSMFRISTILAVVFLFGNSFLAQDQKTQEQPNNEENLMKQWEKIFSTANESAIFENGKVIFLKQPISNEGEKLFSFIHAEDGKSFVLTDEKGIKLPVALYNDKRIQSIVMPNGEKVVINWKQTSSGKWFPDNKNLGCDKNSLESSEDGSNPCRDAVVAVAVAAFVCAASPGSAGCWAATANAAYHTYRCYEATQLAIIPNNNSLRSHERRFVFGQTYSKKNGFAKIRLVIN